MNPAKAPLAKAPIVSTIELTPLKKLAICCVASSAVSTWSSAPIAG